MGRIDNPLTGAFRQQGESQPKIRALASSNLLVTEILSERQDLVVVGNVPQDEAYVVTLHLRNRPRGGMWAEGRWIQTQNFHSGNCGIADLRMKLSSEYAGAFHYISFYLRAEALARLADDDEVPRISELNYRPGIGFTDPVVRHLLLSLKPALASDPAETSAVFADHLAYAFVGHIAHQYGEMRRPRPLPRNCLAPWQERRAKELLDSRLDGNVKLAELAAVCELSVRHFARGFRQSTGQSPYQWLIERRLEQAQGLLELSTRSLSEIATACGFASQSHFTRVFTRKVGLSPGAWRRQRRS